MRAGGRQPSWRECRAFLADLDRHAGHQSAGKAVPHVDSCRACAGLLQSTVAQIQLLEQLPRPVPTELGSPEFLHRIYERAGAAAESRVRPVLERALTGQTAPTDADWLAAEDADEVAASLARSLPSGPAPGWLWKRIQNEIRTLVADRRRARLSRRVRVLGLIAASLLVSVLALRVFLIPDVEGQTVPQIEFRTMPAALDFGFSPVGAVRQVGEER